MRLALFIAFRYLFAKKSHHVINIISLISAVGIGIGSLALIVILSVYNGFDNLIKDLYESYEADFIISPAKGKTLEATPAFMTQIRGIREVEAACPTLEENVFIKYGENQSVATVKGIDTAYERVSSISGNLVSGEFKTRFGEVPHAIVGQQLAQDLLLQVRFLTPLEIYFPDRHREISLINPMQDLREVRLFPSGIIRLDPSFDKKHLFAPLETVAELIGYENHEATSIEVYLNVSPREGAAWRGYHTMYENVGKQLEQMAGERGVVKDRFRQNEAIYKMMKAEKFSVYLILFFVILIISINIFSSLTILMIDKQEDISTFLSMGAGKELINRIFVLQGWLISILGAFTGITLGLIICFLQQYFEIIQIPGSFIVSAYPVSVQLTDVLISFTGVALIGYLIALLATRNR